MRFVKLDEWYVLRRQSWRPMPLSQRRLWAVVFGAMALFNAVVFAHVHVALGLGYAGVVVLDAWILGPCLWKEE